MSYLLEFHGHAHLLSPVLRCESCDEDRPAVVVARRWTCPVCDLTHVMPEVTRG